MRFGYVAIFCAFLYVSPFIAFAQSGASIVLSPEFPGPNEPYTASLGGVYEPGATVRWFIDNKEDKISASKKTISLTASDLNSKQSIRALILTRNGVSIKVEKTVIPVRVDILIDANTVAPAFYGGRHLPSSGSSMSAQALVFQGTSKSTNALSYVWTIGDNVQNGGFATTDNSVSFTTGFENSILVGVSVLQNGQTIAMKSVFVPIIKPEILFYEKNPLRGLSYVALHNPHIFIGDELQLRAEGYFMSNDIALKNILQEWKINNVKTQGDAENPQEITLRKQGTTGTSNISFQIRNLQQLLQGVVGSISVQF